jgi:hypothetical protein
MARPLNYNPVSRLNVSMGGPKLKVNAMSFGKLIEALVDGPCTYEDLRDECGLKVQTIRGVVKVLMGEIGGVKKMVRICGWDMNARNIRNIMVFEWAPGKRDVPRPCMTMAERAAKYRDKKRQSIRALTKGLNNFESGIRHDHSREESVNERT